MPQFTPESSRYHTVENDFHVGVQPVDESLSDQLYGTNLLKKGYAPFVVSVVNNSPERIFVRRAPIRFTDIEGNQWFPSCGLELYDRGDINPMTLMSFMPGNVKLTSYSLANSYDAKRLANYCGKDLPRELELLPGGREQGVVIFRQPEIKGFKNRERSPFEVYKGALSIPIETPTERKVFQFSIRNQDEKK
jgi:hypothetical protein